MGSEGVLSIAPLEKVLGGSIEGKALPPGHTAAATDALSIRKAACTHLSHVALGRLPVLSSVMWHFPGLYLAGHRGLPYLYNEGNTRFVEWGHCVQMPQVFRVGFWYCRSEMPGALKAKTWTTWPPWVVDIWVPLSQCVPTLQIMAKFGAGCACDAVQMPLVILSLIT